MYYTVEVPEAEFRDALLQHTATVLLFDIIFFARLIGHRVQYPRNDSVAFDGSAVKTADAFGSATGDAS